MKKIPLTNGKYALVDDSDYEYVARFSWHQASTKSRSECVYRAVRIGELSTSLSLAAMIVEYDPSTQTVIHLNKNPLDYRKSNLRVGETGMRLHRSKKMSHRAGRPTSSKYKGVWRPSKKNMWRASISIPVEGQTKKKQIKIGSYRTEKEAARAYNKKAKEIYGECAYQNEIGV